MSLFPLIFVVTFFPGNILPPKTNVSNQIACAKTNVQNQTHGCGCALNAFQCLFASPPPAVRRSAASTVSSPSSLPSTQFYSSPSASAAASLATNAASHSAYTSGTTTRPGSFFNPQINNPCFLYAVLVPKPLFNWFHLRGSTTVCTPPPCGISGK